MKVCKTCKLEKQEEAFRTTTNRYGKIYLRGTCRDCDNRWNGKYRDRSSYSLRQLERNRALKERNRSWLEEQKNRPCVDCGKSYPSYCMDFDHVSGVKKAGLAELAQTTRSLEILKVEAAKCEVVCAICHRIRTHWRSHGRKEEAA